MADRAAARARPRRCRRCRGSCRWRTRTTSRRARARAGAPPSRRAAAPARRAASRRRARAPGRRPARRRRASATIASAVSQTGDWQASRRRLCSVLDREALEALEPGAHHRVLERVAAQVQRDQRVDPRRLDAAPGAVGLLAAHDPALGARQRGLAQRAHRPALVERAARGRAAVSARAGRRRAPGDGPGAGPCSSSSANGSERVGRSAQHDRQRRRRSGAPSRRSRRC